MPGITGIISKKPREEKEQELQLMVKSMMHEAFYISGEYTNEKLGLYAGWVCHKGSFSDCMPIFNENKDLVLLFSGENYADQEVIDHLRTRGHEFDSSNASYLIHLYEDIGDGFLSDLNGFFHGVVVDFRNGKVILFNDRYGMQRIYYHETEDEFLFSSEAKSLFKVRPELRNIDYGSLGQFFSFGCTLKNKTLFHNIFLLPGGSAWTFQNGNLVKRHQYFNTETWESQPVLEKETYYDKLRGAFIRILPRYFNSKNPIGFSLTGGLDTRLILACIGVPPGTMPCYTFGGMYRDSLDVKISRRIAEICKQTHQTLRLDNNFLSDFPKLAEKTIYITDGSRNATGAANLYVNKLAREIAPIRMTGNSGQEVLRSYVAFKPISFTLKCCNGDFRQNIRNAEKSYVEISGGDKLSFSLFKQAPWYHYGNLALEQSQLIQRSPYMDNDFVRIVYQAPVEATANEEIALRLIRDSNPQLAEIMTDRGNLGKSFLLSYFTRAYYKFLFKMEYYYNHGMPQRLVKIDHTLRVLELERLFIGHYKYYFFRKWFQNELSEYIKDVLLDGRTMGRPYLDKEAVSRVVKRHVEGKGNHTYEIDMILTTELFQRLLIDQW